MLCWHDSSLAWRFSARQLFRARNYFYADKTVMMNTSVILDQELYIPSTKAFRWRNAFPIPDNPLR